MYVIVQYCTFDLCYSYSKYLKNTQRANACWCNKNVCFIIASERDDNPRIVTGHVADLPTKLDQSKNIFLNCTEKSQ